MHEPDLEDRAATLSPSRWARWRRRMIRALLVLVVAYVAAVAFGMPMGWPYDYPANLGFTPMRDDLRQPADGRRRVAVLQHGIMRSSVALLRLERALRDHGYEVHNLDYPSTSGRLEDFAELLAGELAELRKDRAVDEWYLVGHSMGGLVIEQYLRRPDVPPPTACVYIATPHRGAALADLRKRWFLYRLFMGTEAAFQLSPGDPFHRQEIPFRERSGVIVGDIGEGNASIPGHDDGTVGVEEARLEGAAATLVVPFGHTRIASAPATIEQVLAFLRTGHFENR